jgi:hypothetical protein
MYSIQDQILSVGRVVCWRPSSASADFAVAIFTVKDRKQHRACHYLSTLCSSNIAGCVLYPNFLILPHSCVLKWQMPATYVDGQRPHIRDWNGWPNLRKCSQYKSTGHCSKLTFLHVIAQGPHARSRNACVTTDLQCWFGIGINHLICLCYTVKLC